VSTNQKVVLETCLVAWSTIQIAAGTLTGVCIFVTLSQQNFVIMIALHVNTFYRIVSYCNSWTRGVAAAVVWPHHRCFMFLAC